jgi:hypothetical protein
MFLKNFLGFAALLGSFASPAMATTINFDSLSPTGLISGPYQGLNWFNVAVENGVQGVSGYSNGIVSAGNAAYNGSGTLAAIYVNTGTFTFNSAFFTGAFGSENVVVSDDKGDSSVFSVNSASPTLEVFNWTGVKEIDINAQNPGFKTQVVFDNVVVNEIAAVPEPSTWAMMILGFAGIGAMTYRRRKCAIIAA